MSRKAIRILVSVVVVSGALGALLYTTLSSDTEYYKHVDEVMSSPQAWYGKALQLHGYVANDVARKPNTLDWRFSIQNNGATVVANYDGVVPDTFKPGAEVVLRGRLTPAGFQVAPNGVVAKCPSKYEAAKTGSAGGAD